MDSDSILHFSSNNRACGNWEDRVRQSPWPPAWTLRFGFQLWRNLWFPGKKFCESTWNLWLERSVHTRLVPLAKPLLYSSARLIWPSESWEQESWAPWGIRHTSFDFSFMFSKLTLLCNLPLLWKGNFFVKWLVHLSWNKQILWKNFP